MFDVGEIINPETYGLRIQITSIEPLEAVVIKSETIYPSQRKWADRFFPVGGKLRFVRTSQDQTIWRIESTDPEMPWYILGIYNGRKMFEHYR